MARHGSKKSLVDFDAIVCQFRRNWLFCEGGEEAVSDFGELSRTAKPPYPRTESFSHTVYDGTQS